MNGTTAAPKFSEMPSVSVGWLTESLSRAYANLLKQGKPLGTFPSVMLWGQPGVGKSEAVRQIAADIREETGRECIVTDVRLLLFNPVDLRGIPVANREKTLAVWLKPKIFQMNPSPDVVNILFLDEISAAPPSVQAAAYQITLDKTVGEHKLPDNCVVLAAGNRVTDKSVAYNMPKALANRLMHFEVVSDVKSWLGWACRNALHPYVIGFIGFRPDCLNRFDESRESLAFATPRSWKMVSDILKDVCADANAAHDFIAGLVGRSVASEFRTWCDVFASLPDIGKIFEGVPQPVPTGVSALYALCSSMVSYASGHKDDMTGIMNSIRYAYGFPKDFAIMLLEDYMSMEKDYVLKLLKYPEFMRLAEKSGCMPEKLGRAAVD